MFAGPPDQSAAWSDSGAEGAFRYLRRLWAFGVRQASVVREASDDFSRIGNGAKALRREIHLLLKQIRHDYDRLQYNTVASGAMKLLNALEGFDNDGSGASNAALREGLSVLLRTLYPVCPHISHALWAELGFAAGLGDLIDAPWPQVDETALLQDEIELVLQIAGKTRGAIRVPAAADRSAIEATALAAPEFAKFAAGKPARKVVIVPGRLVNVVV
jgi:leucyl-tRNA synthetase